MSTNGESNGVGHRLGLSGLWRDLANFGAVGLLCFFTAWMTMVEIPALREELRIARREAHQQWLEEQRMQRQHDSERTAKLYEAIRELRRTQ